MVRVLACALILPVVAAMGCLFDGSIPAETPWVTCAGADECPSVLRCTQGFCLDVDVSPPEVEPVTLVTNEDTPLEVTLPVRTEGTAAPVVDFHPAREGALVCAGVTVCPTGEGAAAAFPGCVQSASGCTTVEGAFPTYLPRQDFVGDDAFTVIARAVVRAGGPELTGAAAEIVTRVLAVNDAPAVALGVDRVNLEEDGEPVQVAVVLTDPDDAPATLRVGFESAVGVLDRVTWLPDEGVAVLVPPAVGFGADTVTFIVTDAAGSTGRASLAVEVRPRLRALPSASALTVDEDGRVDFRLAASGGEAPTFRVVAEPAHGLLAVDPVSGAASYSPAPDRTEDVVFSFVVEEGERASPEVEVAIDVVSIPDAPRIVEPLSGSLASCAGDVLATFCLLEEAFVDIAIRVEDPDTPAEELRVELVQRPTRGIAITDGLSVTYTPDPNVVGLDTLSIVVTEIGPTPLRSPTVALSVAIEPIADAVVAGDISIRLAEDTAAIGALVGEDPDGEPLLFEIVTPPAHAGRPINLSSGTFDPIRGFVLYEPVADFAGEDAFTYVVHAGDRVSAPATATITVDGIPDPPRPGPASPSLLLDANRVTVLDLVAAGIVVEPDGEPLRIIDVAEAFGGTFVVAPGEAIDTIEVTPAPALDAGAIITVTDCDDGAIAAGTAGCLLSVPLSIRHRSRKSCRAILDAGESRGDGVYVLDDGAPDGEETYLAYCDMTHAGGGWTLAMKLDGSRTTFLAGSPEWTRADPLRPAAPDLDLTEAKLLSASRIKPQEVLLGVFPRLDGFGSAHGGGPAVPFEPRLIRYGRITGIGSAVTSFLDATSRASGITLQRDGLASLFTAGTIAGLPGSAPQDCTLDGFGRGATVNGVFLVTHRLGAGFAVGSCTGITNIASLGASTSPSVGIRSGGKVLPAFAWVFVREGPAVGTPATCGNGVVEASEKADRGVGSCTVAPFCGDGIVQAERGEICDDEEGGCAVNVCLPLVCGDRLIVAEEQCDDGNGACEDGCCDCALEGCGDLIVQPGLGETCDEGGCSETCCDCRVPACGNGFCEEIVFESSCSCPGDCPEQNGFCGDGCCQPFEDSCNCDFDCGSDPSCFCSGFCGDGCCEAGEDPCNCESDCGFDPACFCNGTCGDGCCDGSETGCDCEADCGPDPSCACGDGTCDLAFEDCGCSDCASDISCASTCNNVCGDGCCDFEEEITCPDDCP